MVMRGGGGMKGQSLIVVEWLEGVPLSNGSARRRT